MDQPSFNLQTKYHRHRLNFCIELHTTLYLMLFVFNSESNTEKNK